MKRKVWLLFASVTIVSVAVYSQTGPAPYRVYDVSPDMRYATHDGGDNTGGKTITVATDPRDPNLVYAATEYAGVWKSPNGGRFWVQSSRGIQASQSLTTGPVLAVDPVNASRLVYVTDQEDYRPRSSNGHSRWGGLYVSLDASGSWTHVDLPHAPKGPVAFGTEFGRAHALVLTTGGIYISTDERLATWVAAPNPKPSPSEAEVVPSYMAAEGTLGGETVFAAAGRVVYRSSLSALLNFARNPSGLPHPWTSGRALGLELPAGFDVWRVAVGPTFPFAGGLKDEVIVLSLKPAASYCPAGGSHNGAGYVYSLQGGLGEGQGHWRWCSKCMGLFFGDGNPQDNRCPRPGGGPHDPEGSDDYHLRREPARSGEQTGWKWCWKCQGMFYALNGASRCPAGDPHDGSRSYPYVLASDGRNRDGWQNGWRYCDRCKGLFYSASTQFDVSLLNFSRRTRTDLHFDKGDGGSGMVVLAAARPVSTTSGEVTAGSGYDLFAGDRTKFYKYRSGGTWEVQPSLHWDTWSLAFAANYDPPRGIPTMYASHDGGVSVRMNDPARPWVAAMAFLHALNSTTMAGIGGDRDVLYVPSGHNDGWVSTNGGQGWSKIGGVGDNAQAFVDPTLPGEVAFGRNSWVRVFRSATPRVTAALGTDPSADVIGGNSGVTDLEPLGYEPPGLGRFAQVLTLPGETPVEHADYVAVGSNISRSTDGGRTWPNILPASQLTAEEVRSIRAIAASGGHRAPTIYFLIVPEHEDAGLGIPSRSYIKSSVVNPATGLLSDFRTVTGPSVSGSPVKPAQLIVHPYDPRVVYTIDLEDGRVYPQAGQRSYVETARIKSLRTTPAGEAVWRDEPQLREIATNNGEYSFSFQRGLGTARASPVQQILFSQSDPNLRIAILFNGIAFSRNAGLTWSRIDDNLQGMDMLDFQGVRRLSDLVARPYSGFLSEYGGRQSLYVALHGRGVIRIDGPFR
jgi:hypothetical protein